MPCFLVWGFWLVSRPAARGVLAALSGWTKFASLLVVPLWLTYPGRRPSWRFALGFAAATLAAFSVLLLEPDPFHEAHVFWTRTVGFQIGRDAPWSLWDWRQYHARGLPDLHLVQRFLQGAAARGSGRARLLPAPQVAAAARRAHGGAPRGLRARRDVLALHVHPVVLPLRRARPPRAGGAAAEAWSRRSARSLRRRSPKRRIRTGRSPSRGRRSRTAWTEDRLGRRFGTCGGVTESGSLFWRSRCSSPPLSRQQAIASRYRRGGRCRATQQKGPCSSGPLPPIPPSALPT